ncbi:hypothetical protein HYH03_005420 [Edaphochlamys debaryana]|uniref:Uncharacterized protein n=1 Tax=Edaphochlamys debaryana TaxID=47281 RepID=A0A835Y896_9CHLO|nr:hypothetical protein HYH03_005420 [Edaphochlamys debaryana]|eukprot:KAG2496598.1 hypothetical protein HYH03_005420 [Edaphochlamys debaryana]
MRGAPVGLGEQARRGSGGPPAAVPAQGQQQRYRGGRSQRPPREEGGERFNPHRYYKPSFSVDPWRELQAQAGPRAPLTAAPSDGRRPAKHTAIISALDQLLAQRPELAPGGWARVADLLSQPELERWGWHKDLHFVTSVLRTSAQHELSLDGCMLRCRGAASEGG